MRSEYEEKGIEKNLKAKNGNSGSSRHLWMVLERCPFGSSLPGRFNYLFEEAKR
jgi:hypothetical protein